MRRKFIITIKDSNKIEDKQIAEYLQKNNFGWWKYFNEMWIVLSPKDSTTSREIRTDIDEILTIKRKLLVLDIGTEDIDWAAIGVAKDFDWFKRNDF